MLRHFPRVRLKLQRFVRNDPRRNGPKKWWGPVPSRIIPDKSLAAASTCCRETSRDPLPLPGAVSCIRVCLRWFVSHLFMRDHECCSPPPIVPLGGGRLFCGWRIRTLFFPAVITIGELFVIVLLVRGLGCRQRAWGVDGGAGVRGSGELSGGLGPSVGDGIGSCSLWSAVVTSVVSRTRRREDYVRNDPRRNGPKKWGGRNPPPETRGSYLIQRHRYL